jgi:predicted PurR-regulated permease PerM
VDGRQPPSADRPPGLPDWFQTLGRGAWLLVGVAVLLAIAFFLLGLISDLLIPLIFAAILAGVGQQIVSETVHSFRGYARGVTIIGLMNGVVIGLGAAVLGVPLVLPIAILNFVTSYIPFYGAFFAGAFAVLIALGANGIGVALAMLAITLLTNNTLQNLLEPLVFGKTLRLHPLVVMLVTTAGTLLFGLLGATLAAPVTAVAMRTIDLLRGTGRFPAANHRSGRPSTPTGVRDLHGRLACRR